MLQIVARCEGRELWFPIPDGQATLGASHDNDLVIPFPGVSRHHAVIRSRRGLLQIVDSGSKNGVRVKGERVGVASLEGRRRTPLRLRWGPARFGQPPCGREDPYPGRGGSRQGTRPARLQERECLRNRRLLRRYGTRDSKMEAGAFFVPGRAPSSAEPGGAAGRRPGRTMPGRGNVTPLPGRNGSRPIGSHCESPGADAPDGGQ